MNYKRVYIIIAIIIAVLIGGYFYMHNGNDYETYTVQTQDVREGVSVIGTVEPMDRVDLGFQRAGRVDEIYVEKNTAVSTGKKLAQLDDAELRYKRQEAQANLAVEQAVLEQLNIKVAQEKVYLEELQKGTRPEQIDVAQKKVAQAQSAIDTAEISVADAQQNATQEINSLYENALPLIKKSLVIGKNALLTLTDLQYTHFDTSSVEQSRIATTKTYAMSLLFDVNNAGRWAVSAISPLQSGLFTAYDAEMQQETHETAPELLQKTRIALGAIQDTLNSVTIDSSFTATDKTNLATEKKNVNDQIISLAAQVESIVSQKVTNQQAVNAEEAALESARQSLAVAQSDLTLLQSGTIQEKVDKQKLVVQEAQTNVKKQQAVITKVRALIGQYNEQIRQSIISTPINGVVTRINIEEGEVVAAAEKVFTLISENKFEVIVDVPEVHISKLQNGQIADVWFDAFGSDQLFKMQVFEIDLAEELIEGIVTYQVHLKLLEADDRIKSGMTANVLVNTFQKDDVLVIPNNYIVYENGDAYVMVIRDDQPITQKIELGDTATSGLQEVVAGLQVNDILVKK